VSERLQLKRTAMKQLDELASPKTIIASNSSSFTITEIVERLELRHPRRCVNLHSCKCLNPSLKSLAASEYQH
jgi:3-hydroxyacyl-CoA dehydrogenase